MSRNRGHSHLCSLVLSAIVTISILVWTNNAAVLYSTETEEDPGSVSLTITTGEQDENNETRLDSMISGAAYDEERCPPLPDLSKVTHKICEVKSCVQDGDCSSLDFVCCFNGCIHSCIPRIQPPPPFDWLEERPVNLYDVRGNDDTSHNDDETSSSEEGDSRTLILGSTVIPGIQRRR